MNTKELKESLELESGTLCWEELEKHFARGVIRIVSLDTNMIDIAIDIAQDNSEKIATALASKTLTEATDSQAKQWQQLNSVFRCVVIAPFVLIQENKT